VIRDKVKEIKKMHPNFTNPHIAHVAERKLKERGILVKLNRATVRNILPIWDRQENARELYF